MHDETDHPMTVDEFNEATISAPEGAIYRVGFKRLRGSEEYWVFTFAPSIEDTKAEAVERLAGLGQDPAHYDLKNPMVQKA